jgi:hypothetical protein
VTPHPGSYPDPSNPVTTQAPPVTTPARQFTEPLRELSAFALLIGNGVFLALGFSGLFFVVHRWGADFGLRSEAVFSTFVGPVSLGFPLVAMLLATHVAPMVRRARSVLMTIMVQLGVSAVFGAITFLGAFAHDLSSARATIEGTLGRAVWLAFLVLACIIFTRLWLGLNPAPKPRPAGYSGYGQPTYGRPYPGQPLYPHSTYPAGSGQAAAGSPTAGSPSAGSPGAVSAGTGIEDPADTASTGWPLVPPPPRPAPLVVESAGDQTMRISIPPPGQAGDLTQKVPAHPVPSPTATTLAPPEPAASPTAPAAGAGPAAVPAPPPEAVAPSTGAPVDTSAPASADRPGR